MINEANPVDLESTPMLTPTEVLEHIWCPRFTWFMNVQHIPQHEENRYKVLKGRAIHTRKATENKAYLRRKMGVVDKQIEVYLASPQLRLRGIVDEIVWLKDGSLAPLDYKYTVASEHDNVFKTHQTQIRIYALLAESVYKQEVTKGFVAYIRGQNKFYEVPVSPDDRTKINLILDDIFDIIQTGCLPKRSSQANHCLDCCYRNICV